ncbi:Actin-binding protein IPP [Eumeta japonica]|uniref:Actin-binding protein IPP n=1 Tax=Eumeta variegata TaxID=151549 RepID=A0A4C1Y7V0_EUMVA|nr:Actin-binding protein IPP [Eumeta japonica]
MFTPRVLRAALRWLGHEPESRKQHCVEVLRRVRLRLVGPHALEEALNNVQDPYMAGMLDLLKAVLASREPRERARRHLYVVGGVRHDLSRIDVLEALHTVERLDTCKKVWEEVAPMHFHRSAPGVAVIGNRLYAVGGRGSRNLLANGEAYDPVSNKWSRIADMSKPRRSFGLVALHNKLYAFGGVGDLNREASVEVYDPELDEWTVVGEMPEPRCGMGVVSYDGAAYLVGGSTQTQGYTNDLLHYNPVTGEWRRLAPLKHARGCTAAVVLDSRLYVVGGGAIPGDSDEFIPSNRVECYIFAKNEWEVIRCIREARVGCMAGAAGGVLVVAGGHCGVNVNDVITDRVELYDSWEKKWAEGPSLPHSRSFAGAAVL